MISYTTLYGLYVITSTLLFYALLLLARYARQIKSPPADEDFIALATEKETLLSQSDQLTQDLQNAQTLVKNLELEVKKLDDALKAVQSSNPAAAEAPSSDAAAAPASN